jgi:hypothetical protein
LINSANQLLNWRDRGILETFFELQASMPYKEESAANHIRYRKRKCDFSSEEKMEKIQLTFFVMLLIGLMMLALWVLSASAANF